MAKFIDIIDGYKISKGNTQRQAYLKAYPSKKNWKESSLDSNASVLFRQEKVRQRYDELLNEMREIETEKTRWTREQSKEKWDSKYPQISKSWTDNWIELTAYYKYPEEIRRIIYTTNAVEGFHRMLRKITKTKSSYPTDDSLRKSIYLANQEISKKWSMPIRDWGIIIGQLMIFFDDRIGSEIAV